MEVELYGAALFQNPRKFFDIKDRDFAYSSRLRMKFNDVLQKMVTDMILLEKISKQADHYENSRMSFGKQMAINQRKSKSPLDWWGAFGGNNVELALFAKRIVGLCCSSSGCERNWSTFEFIHTKKRNRLEHQRLNDLLYVQHNRKIATRFQKRREEGRNFNPLILEDFQWDNEWVNGEIIGDSDGDLWNAVDRALDASEGIENRRSSRRDESRGSSSSSQPNANEVEMEEYENEVLLNDDEDAVDDYGCLNTAPSNENVAELETNEVDIDDFT